MKKILPILLLIAFLNTSAGYVGDLPDLGEAFKEEQKNFNKNMSRNRRNLTQDRLSMLKKTRQRKQLLL